MYYEVLVRSVVKPMLKNKGIMEFERGNQQGAIGILAGALAEEFCDRYGDTLQPEAAAAAAERAYDRLMAILMGVKPPTPRLGDEAPRAADITLEKKH